MIRELDLTLVIPMCLFNSYKYINFSQTQQLITQIFLWQHVSTLLSHHQAFWRTDPMYQHL